MMRAAIRGLAHGPFSRVFFAAHAVIAWVEYHVLLLKWRIEDVKKPDQAAIELMKQNVTFIYKSFERQKQAIKLYWSIQSYYPGVKVIIADDSRKPLELRDRYAEVIQLPFNSGLSYGLNRALERVTTPYVIRLDDDQLLTPYSRFDVHLRFLMTGQQVDLISVLQLSTTSHRSIERAAQEYYGQPMQIPHRKLKIPHMTRIGEYIVVGKAPNVFIARTDKIKEIGYDDHIRMIDHNEFFYRAAGRLVSALSPVSYVFHDHNRFDEAYQKYRADVDGDRRYIARKMRDELIKYASSAEKQK